MNRVINIVLTWAFIANSAFAVFYNYNQQQKRIDVQWTTNDRCRVFTTANTGLIFWSTNGGSNSATFSAYGFSLSPYARYYAYYPYSSSSNPNNNPMTAIPVRYDGQSQNSNDNASHLSEYDYMTAETLFTADVCNFRFRHINSIIRIECDMQGAQTLHSLELSADSRSLITTGTVNVTTGSFTPTGYSNAITLSLNDIHIADGEHLVAYIMLPPIDLTGATLGVAVTTANGMVASAEMKGAKLLSGNVYPIELKMSEPTKGATPRRVEFSKQKSAARAASASDGSMNAFVPDFSIDPYNKLEQIQRADNIPTKTINHHTEAASATDRYTIDGMKTTSHRRGALYIHNGKKYLEQ